MPEASPSYFHHQSVTIFPKSVNTLTLEYIKPLQPSTLISNLSIKNTNLFAPR